MTTALPYASYVVTMADPCMQIDEGEVEIPEA